MSDWSAAACVACGSAMFAGSARGSGASARTANEPLLPPGSGGAAG